MEKACNRDGWVRALVQDDVQPGTVIREVSKEPGFQDGAIVPPFADAVILRVDWETNEFGDPLNEATVTVARPYLYASSVGTTAPTALVGYEKFEVKLSRLLRTDSVYMLVVGSRGQSFKMET